MIWTPHETVCRDHWFLNDVTFFPKYHFLLTIFDISFYKVLLFDFFSLYNIYV